MKPLLRTFSRLSTRFPVARIVVSNALFWLTLCLIGAAGAYSDALRRQDHTAFSALLTTWCWAHVPVFLLGVALHLFNRRQPEWFVSAKRVAIGYLLVLVLFLPCELLFTVAHDRIEHGWSLSFDLWRRVLEMPRFGWFIEFAWTSGTYIGVVAFCIWHRHRQREQIWRQAEHDNLTLRLALEEQKLQTLRGQLEPHFMFNALNAISALVRSNNPEMALSGITRLSSLLRYALATSQSEWVTVADELQFTRDYLALQRLRYGERLQVRIEGDSDDVLRADCLALLLQPLVENALRHGLDAAMEPGAVTIVFAKMGQALKVHITNPIMPSALPNPGAGIGLSNVRERLHNAYGGTASLAIDKADGFFSAILHLPTHLPMDVEAA
ncbi:histidine kinase [Duganella sp. BJB1802]|uniref:sensor histidine kinase n=1 Tax=Duganella sp. BJB1802 TaxID=2744575 RepID=UPI001592FB2C|nr:histidine kinase [Duganella sp. BJB1802]NVD69517.1 histidine kinase [Duganella sp. BJB1802]